MRVCENNHFCPRSIVQIEFLEFNLLHTFASRAMSLIQYYSQIGNCPRVVKFVLTEHEDKRIFSGVSGGRFYVVATDALIKHVFEISGALINCAAVRSKISPVDLSLLNASTGEITTISKLEYFEEAKSNYLVNPIFDLLSFQIISHELAHIYFGHLSFLSEITRHVNEINLPRKRIIQCLEGDADCFGALTPIRLKDCGARLPASIRHNEQISNSIEAWAVTAFTFYSHLAQGQFEQVSPPKDHHRSAERCFATVGTVDTYRNIRDGHAAETVGHDLVEAFLFAGECISSAFPESIISFAQNARCFESYTGDRESYFHSDWKVIRPFLEPYKIVKFNLAQPI